MEEGGPWGVAFPRSFSDALALGPPAVVANDAGAAAHIAAWISKPDSQREIPALFVQGPAARILNPDIFETGKDLSSTISARSWALVGTGWQSYVEQDAMRICAQRGIPCIAMVDHWLNYQLRFKSLRAEELPFVVVTDSIALETARVTLPGLSCHLWPNELLSQFARRVHALEKIDSSGRDEIPTLLWINEPFVKKSLAVDPLQDISFTRRLLDLLLAVLIERQMERIIFRQHPSMPSWPTHLQSQLTASGAKIMYSTMDTPLEVDVSRARLVFGLSSYALFLSSSVGRETYSAASTLGLPSRLPSEIVPSWPTSEGSFIP